MRFKERGARKYVREKKGRENVHVEWVGDKIEREAEFNYERVGR